MNLASMKFSLLSCGLKCTPFIYLFFTIVFMDIIWISLCCISELLLLLLLLWWLLLKIKSVAYSPQGSHTGQLDFCNWLADDSTTV